jgi:uncharacterized membrane protein YhhN
MLSPNALLPLLSLASGALAIRFYYRGPRSWVYLFRPLTIILIILIALLETNPVSVPYKAFIIGGLLFSLAGDIFMMLPNKRFLLGLVSFFVCQVCYIFAFRPPSGRPVAPGILLPFIILALLIFRVLAPSLGKLKLPVFLYIAAITAMVWLAAGRFIDSGETKALLAFVGAMLFFVSDTLVGADRFIKKFELAQLFILATYFPAQLLIAMSV